jgi:predicted  nucleic acid-binding Zn-ribbon protein
VERPYQPKQIRNLRTLANAEHWKMRTLPTQTKEWAAAKAERNKHRNAATKLKRKYAEMTKEARKIETIMMTSSSAMQKMGKLKKITNHRRAPPYFLDDRAVNRFQ